MSTRPATSRWTGRDEKGDSMTQETTPAPSRALVVPGVEETRAQLTAIVNFQHVIHSQMVRGRDYGVIPGTQKPTLLQPGAEKIAKLLGLADEYDIISELEDWDKGLFAYKVRCRLARMDTGGIISSGLGACNSMEAKYRWRQAKRVCPECNAEAIIKGKAEWGGGFVCHKKQGGCGAKFKDNDQAIVSQAVGRVLNDDIYSSVNTILKMAKKRALVDAAKSAGSVSDLYTQDLEDFTDTVDVESQAVEDSPAPQAQRPTAPARAMPPTPVPSPAGQAPPVPSGGVTRQEDDLFGGARLASEETKRTLLRVAQSYPRWTWPRISEWLAKQGIPQGTLTERKAQDIIEDWRLRPAAKEPLEFEAVTMPPMKGA